MFQYRTCVHCGNVVAADQEVLCNHCGLPFDAPPIEPKSNHVAVEISLTRVTSRWTVPLVLRHYGNDKKSQELFAQEVEVFGLYGYSPVTQSEDGGHVHVGRLHMTGGLSIFAGKRGIRSDATISVTFQKVPESTAAPTPPSAAEGGSSHSAGLDTLAMLEKLGQLRQAGVLTDEEFETKKADLLSRL